MSLLQRILEECRCRIVFAARHKTAVSVSGTEDDFSGLFYRIAHPPRKNSICQLAQTIILADFFRAMRATQPGSDFRKSNEVAKFRQLDGESAMRVQTLMLRLEGMVGPVFCRVILLRTEAFGASLLALRNQVQAQQNGE